MSNKKEVTKLAQLLTTASLQLHNFFMNSVGKEAGIDGQLMVVIKSMQEMSKELHKVFNLKIKDFQNLAKEPQTFVASVGDVIVLPGGRFFRVTKKEQEGNVVTYETEEFNNEET